jgi:hypothetical protein
MVQHILALGRGSPLYEVYFVLRENCPWSARTHDWQNIQQDTRLPTTKGSAVSPSASIFKERSSMIGVFFAVFRCNEFSNTS